MLIPALQESVMLCQRYFIDACWKCGNAKIFNLGHHFRLFLSFYSVRIYCLAMSLEDLTLSSPSLLACLGSQCPFFFRVAPEFVTVFSLCSSRFYLFGFIDVCAIFSNSLLQF